MVLPNSEKLKSHFRGKFQNDHNSSEICISLSQTKTVSRVDKTEVRSFLTLYKGFFFFLNNVLNIFLVCGKKKKVYMMYLFT